jgi:dynein heavy chain
MSYFTDSKRLQQELELPIDKRSGRRYGPPASKRLIVFIDDLNLPYIETYGTQNAIALLTQHMSYGTIFDRGDLGLRKELVDIQYMAAMNPTAGSFVICERAQRHFATFACLMPSKQDLTIIFRSLMAGHVTGFPNPVMDSVDRIVEASLVLYEDVSKKFLPSAVRFTYNWVSSSHHFCCCLSIDLILSLLFTESARVDKHLPRHLHDSPGRVQHLPRHRQDLGARVRSCHFGQILHDP